jgi:hypothetical protein
MNLKFKLSDWESTKRNIGLVRRTQPLVRRGESRRPYCTWFLWQVFLEMVSITPDSTILKNDIPHISQPHSFVNFRSGPIVDIANACIHSCIFLGFPLANSGMVGRSSISALLSSLSQTAYRHCRARTIYSELAYGPYVNAVRISFGAAALIMLLRLC